VVECGPNAAEIAYRITGLSLALGCLPILLNEFPSGPLEIGDKFPVTPEEIEVEGRKLRQLSPTDSVKDRLVGYIHWKSSSFPHFAWQHGWVA
jgi:hypothetical protein